MRTQEYPLSAAVLGKHAPATKELIAGAPTPARRAKVDLAQAPQGDAAPGREDPAHSKPPWRRTRAKC
eukprot:15436756-Alexandrium_andersonii.AAC.1